MKKWLRLGVAVALGASGGWAVDWNVRYPKPEGYVSDFAHVIDPAGQKQIEAYAAAVEHVTGVKMAFVTIPSLETEPVDAVAESIFRGWGPGDRGDDNSVLLLLSIAEHRLSIAEGRSVASILPSGLADDVLYQMRPALRKNDPGDAIAAAAQTMGSAIGRAKQVHFRARVPHRRYLPGIGDRLNWMLVVGAVVLVLLLSRVPGPGGHTGMLGVLPWLLLGNRGGRSAFGCRGTGGFGGFDSGDGFGGFGGADSGAGGTSSDW
ncbi:MAG TPA: TPM domain-containing protein [Bryobacteraceae bacterium]|jgi:uncharacterized protein|nr:TPM domain-containing protein [Bryobacteraceae bacterium]